MDDSGTSLNDQFTDQRVLIKKKKDDDLKKSKKIESKGAKKSDKAVRKDTKTDDAKKSRQERVWDYIEDDQSSGGVSHEL